MSSSPLAEYLQSRLAAVATRLPLSWINLMAGAPRTIEGRTLDARSQWLLRLIERSGRPPLNRLDIDLARTEYDESMKLLSGNWLAETMLWGGGVPIGEVIDRTIPGAAGPIAVRIYKPQVTAGRKLPAMLWLHGDGWCLGSLDGYDAVCRYFAAHCELIVVAVDYRLAPEHRFPAALDDGMAAWKFLATEAGILGANPAQLVIAGDSAGANLATVLAAMLRDQPSKPAFQLLICPICDLALDTPSMTSCGTGFLLTRDMLAWFRDLYLADQALIADPRVSPLRADDLRGLPPTLLVTAGFDPLRDEGKAYAERLKQAGVAAIHREFDALTHGFIGMRGTLQGAARAMDEIAAGLRHELATLLR